MNEISLDYPRSLPDLLSMTQDAPDDTPVVLRTVPHMRLQDGTYGPPSIPLGRLREELLIRAAFPLVGVVEVR